MAQAGDLFVMDIGQVGRGIAPVGHGQERVGLDALEVFGSEFMLQVEVVVETGVGWRANV